MNGQYISIGPKKAISVDLEHTPVNTKFCRKIKLFDTLGAGVQVYHTLKSCIELQISCHFGTP